MEDPHARLADLAPVYVVDALSEDDRLLFADHLIVCAACRAEVERLRAVAAVLAQAVARAGGTIQPPAPRRRPQP